MTADKQLTAAAVLVAIAAAARQAGAAIKPAGKLTIAIPGPRPTFLALPVFVGRDAGLFKARGLDVDIKVMNASVAAKAVAEGRSDLAFVPTQFAIALAANSKLPLRAIWGIDASDWLLASMDAAAISCQSLKGKTVGIDAARGARWIQLNTILTRKCRLAIDKDVKTRALGGDVVAAMVAGKIAHAILHIDEVKTIERLSGRKLHVVSTLEAAAPGLHYVSLVAQQDRIASRRDALLRLLAGLRDAVDVIRAPANINKVAAMAAPISPSAKDAGRTIETLTAIGFYPTTTPGLERARIELAIDNQLRIGKLTGGRSGVKPGTRAPSADDFADLTLWTDAQRLK